MDQFNKCTEAGKPREMPHPAPKEQAKGYKPGSALKMGLRGSTTCTPGTKQ